MADTAELLRRHAPILRATRGDRYLDGVEVYGDRVGPWLEYWIGYPGDPDHAGTDWEFAAVGVDDADRPLELVLAQHRTAHSRGWLNVETEGDRPVVYVGRQKHASYFARGIYRHGRHVEIALGNVRLDPPLTIGAPVAVRGRLQYRDPTRWLETVTR